jgi:very-short-patch-repair endonuclease
MSKTEWRLWYWLRYRQLAGHKFRRQMPLGPYFADFACLEKRLVVEIDGDDHSEQHTYDARRDAWMRHAGYRVLRFRVTEVDADIEAVVDRIRFALAAPS